MRTTNSTTKQALYVLTSMGIMTMCILEGNPHIGWWLTFLAGAGYHKFFYVGGRS